MADDHDDHDPERDDSPPVPRDRRRRRGFEDDEEPAPRRRYDSEPTSVSVLGILSLIQGIGSLISSFIPCIGVLGIIGGGIGLLLGVFGIVVARNSGRQGTGLPIAGTIVSIFAMLIGSAWLLLMAAMFKKGEVDAVADGGPPITISAVELDREYDANELAADGKYRGKELQVSGTVKKITRDDRPGKITVELDGTPGSTVDCNFNQSDQGELAPIAVGQGVSVRGKCKGKVRTWVTMDDCKLVKDNAPPNNADNEAAGPPVVVTADALDKDYADNVVAADMKYKGKQLELTGKVARVARNKPGKVTLEFKVEEGSTVDCDFVGKDALAQLGAVKVGQEVVVRGTCRGKGDEVVTLDNCALVK
ncbi:MAG: hypothetical protein JWO38_5670 [Gemmataceae bacterium]|nr:hypothetical protein [Gemmataceae bacterium]